MLRLPEADLQRFFEQVAFTVMASNGDGHLKNYGVLYKNLSDVRLAPMFDFGREVCRVQEPRAILRRIADAMSDTLAQARQDERIPATTLSLMTDVWVSGMTHAA
jgi:serine/threonine-protein kinase HipA